MAHLIDMSNDRANMAYAGRVPWHGLGNQINPDDPIEKWQQESGLSFTIEKRPLVFGVNVNGRIEPRTVKNRFAHVRSDTQEDIGIGSDKFNLVQPSEIVEFYRDLLDGSGFQMETLGALNGGARLWGLAKYRDGLRFGDNDILKPYLLLATANDGSMSTVADFTSVRVVCNNTLTFAVGSNGGKASIRIPHSRKFNAEEVKSELGLINDRMSTFALDVDQLTQRKITRDDAIQYFVDLYAKKDEDGNITNMRTVKPTVEKLVNTYRNGPGAELDTSRDTLWGALNAVTNFIDFEMRAQSIDNRFASAQLGHGRDIKKKAFDNALALAA